MKTMFNSLARFVFLLTGLFVSMIGFAQEKSADIDVDINTKGNNNWYTQPWVWIVGGAVFILLLVALLRGSGSKASQ